MECKISNQNMKLIEPINVNNRIKHLEEELANAQADKEFVWSLWRQLQANNPDVTNAISTVIQREKEKNEHRDLKILEIISHKDAKINQLLETIKQKEDDCNQLNDKIKSIEIQLIKKVEECKFFELNSKTLNDKEQMYEQMLRTRDDKHDKALRESECDKQHLVSKLRDLVKEVAESNEKESLLKLENNKLKDTIELLNTQIKQSNSNYEKLMNELNEFRHAIDNNLKLENERLSSDLNAKILTNEKLRNELNDLWSKFNSNADYCNQQEMIIKQLKDNQKNLHLTIKKQQETFQSENDSLKKMYDQISQKYEQIVHNEKQIISETYMNQQQLQQKQALQMKQFKLSEKSNNETVKALQYEIDQLKLKSNLQLQQLSDKKLLVDELKKKLDDYESINYSQESIKRKENIPNQHKSKPNPIKTSHTLNLRTTARSKSMTRSSSIRSSAKQELHPKRSKSFERETLIDAQSDQDSSSELENEKNFDSIQKLKQFYDNLCHAKDKQIETIRTAHQRRLERLVCLEKQHKILKEYLKSYVDEDDIDNITREKPNRKLAALNDSDNLLDDNIGYTRKESDNVLNELKMTRHDNRRLMHENLDLKEKIDLLNVKYVEQNERVQSLTLDLNVKLDEKELDHKEIINKSETDLKVAINKLKTYEDEINSLKEKCKQSDTKCGSLIEERIKFTDLSAKLTEENKKLYKKWFQMRKNENKFKSLLIEQMNKRSQVRIKRKVYKKEPPAKESTNEEDFELLKIGSSSSNSITLSSEDEQIVVPKTKTTKNKPQNTLNQKTTLLFRKKFDELNSKNLSLETKIEHLNAENQKLTKELSNSELKIKQLKTQNEHQLIEITSLKKKEFDYKEKEDSFKKQDEQTRDELKKTYESKIKQVTTDLNKQISLTRTLRTENDKLSDKLKVNEEKLNHTDRDNSQKKQLIEFYKKKLEEFNQKEKNEIILTPNEAVTDLKQQIKKLSETVEKQKGELKSLKSRIQSVQNEKTNMEVKFNEQESKLNDINSKYESVKKDKHKLETTLKNSRQKLAELEEYAKELEDSTELNIKNLSESSQETLAIAQYRLKYAFKSVEDYERIFKYLYESLINRCIDLRKEIKQEKLYSKKYQFKRAEKSNQSLDENMKKAMDLASSVLNLTSNELEDILLTSNSIENDEILTNQNSFNDDDDYLYKKQCQKLLFEFDQYLNSSKKEVTSKNIENSNEALNKNICDLVSQRLNDVLQYEKELAIMNSLKK